MPRKDQRKSESSKAKPAKRKRLSHSDAPLHSLRDALTVAQALTDNYAGDATSPLQVAISLDISPTSSAWRSLTGAAVAYGLTTSAYNSKLIGLEELGRRATAPTEEGDDVKARAEAALKPGVFAGFFSKYNGAKFPPDKIAKNVLQHNFEVPENRVDEVLNTLRDNGAYVGFIHDTKGGPFVSTDDLSPSPVTLGSGERPTEDGSQEEAALEEITSAPTSSEAARPGADARPFSVFISHGHDMAIVKQVKDVLGLYDIEYEVAVEEQTPAIPVPQKVLTAMRKCSAGVMIVCADDESAAATGTINNNVLIEIGAAFVLYDQKVVLLWDKRLKVPSNLQGLFRCEFEGDQLTFDAGTKLAKAIKAFRK